MQSNYTIWIEWVKCFVSTWVRIVEGIDEESLTVTCRIMCCECVSANLDVILGVQSLDETGETVKETIRCSSLEGGWGRGRRGERASFSTCSNQQWYQPELSSSFCQVPSCICTNNVQQLITVFMSLIHYYVTDKSMTISSEVLQTEM